MTSEALKHYTNEFRSRRDVSPYDAVVFFESLIAESDEEAVTSLLTAWNSKGVTEDELYRFAKIMRGRMRTVDTRGVKCVDIVGSGGSGRKTFNVSTAAAFVAAGAGIAVAKHGNRAATSSSGSADVLTHLGVAVDAEPEAAESNLAEHGICFMFAPRHHSLSATLAAARKRVGSPTIFNLLGPLCNPAQVGHQVIGVYARELVPKLANTLAKLGTTRSWIVNGHDSLDEMSITGHSTVAEVTANGVKHIEVGASDVGIETLSGDIPQNCSPEQSAAVISSILDGEMADSDAEKLVLLNAAAAIYVSGGANDLVVGVRCSKRKRTFRCGEKEAPTAIGGEAMSQTFLEKVTEESRSTSSSCEDRRVYFPSSATRPLQ